jgi:hypothetical protein
MKVREDEEQGMVHVSIPLMVALEQIVDAMTGEDDDRSRK